MMHSRRRFDGLGHSRFHPGSNEPSLSYVEGCLSECSRATVDRRFALFRPIILVTNAVLASALVEVVRAVDVDVPVEVFTGRDGVVDVLAQRIKPDSLLVCFSSGVIVPTTVIARLDGPAYNFHAASPDYPGRDVHHFAVYRGVRRYGATAHKLAARVDAGPIVGVEWFDVLSGTTPEALKGAAIDAALRLYRALMPLMMREGELPDIGIAWSGRKWLRSDFRAICRLDPSISREEFERRYFAFDGGKYDNLTVMLHGCLLRIDKGGKEDVAADRRKVLCVDATIDREAFEKCRQGLETSGFDGLAVKLHGRLFRIERE